MSSAVEVSSVRVNHKTLKRFEHILIDTTEWNPNYTNHLSKELVTIVNRFIKLKCMAPFEIDDNGVVFYLMTDKLSKAMYLASIDMLIPNTLKDLNKLIDSYEVVWLNLIACNEELSPLIAKQKRDEELEDDVQKIVYDVESNDGTHIIKTFKKMQV